MAHKAFTEAKLAFLSELHPLNASFPILLTLKGMLMESKPVEPSKADTLILSTS